MAASENLSIPGSLFWGLSVPWRSVRTILRSPTLILWSALPVALTTFLYFWVLSSLQDSSKAALIRAFNAWGWDPQGWTAGLVVFLSKVVLLLVGALTFSFVAGIVASPLNDFLAEKAESRVSPPMPPAQPTSWTGKIRLIGIDIVKTLAAALAALLALLLSWIPVLNIAAFALTFLLVAFQYTSYPQTRRGAGIREGLTFVMHHPMACLGFGAATSLLFAIPLLSVLVLPIAVVGGTLLAARAPGGEKLPRLR